MPFIRVGYLENQYAQEELPGISRAIMDALIQHFQVPENDFFQVFHAHKRDEFRYSPDYLDVSRSDRLLYIQITLASGRSRERKRAFYGKLAELLAAECGIRKEDVFAVLAETELEDWTFGNGEAQMIAGAEREEKAGDCGRKDGRIASDAAETFGAIAPAFVRYTEDVLFGDVWRREGLSPRERSLLTVAALTAGGNAEQLPFHLRLARENGLSEEELAEALTHLAFYAGWPRAASALLAARETFGS